MVLLNNLLSSSWYILQKKYFSSDSVLHFSIHIGIFYLKVSRSQPIDFVTAGSQWTTTASPADALSLDQSQLMNNPGYLNYS